MRGFILSLCPVFFLFFLFWSLSGCKKQGGEADRPHLTHHFRQEAYIWQRKWTPEVEAALMQNRAFIPLWHILVAERIAVAPRSSGSSGSSSFSGKLGRTEDLQQNKVPDRGPDKGPEAYLWRDTLLPDGRDGDSLFRDLPVILVFRIDQRLNVTAHQALISKIMQTAQTWRLQGRRLEGVEVDHDAATSKLPEYRSFLQELHKETAKEALPLWITSLPTWLSSPDFPGILAQVDHVVLQVHAVSNPHFGLFNAGDSSRWMAQFAHLAQKAKKPWFVALPNYGTRVSWNRKGQIIALESEARGYGADSKWSRELMASPQEIAHFIEMQERQEFLRDHFFEGWIWFRLPTGQDRRAWSLKAWQAVMQHLPLVGKADFIAEPLLSSEKGATGLYSLFLINNGNSDVLLPEEIRLKGNCPVIEGIGVYRSDYRVINDLGINESGQVRVLRSNGRILLGAGEKRKIGWARCLTGEPQRDEKPL